MVIEPQQNRKHSLINAHAKVREDLKGRSPKGALLRSPTLGIELGLLLKVWKGSYSVGALIIRIGFWVVLYYKYNKEPPQHYRPLFRSL